MVGWSRRDGFSEGAEETGSGDLITGQGDEGVRGVSQVFVWVTGRVVCLSLSEDGIGRRREFSWGELPWQLSQDTQVEMEVGLGAANV